VCRPVRGSLLNVNGTGHCGMNAALVIESARLVEGVSEGLPLCQRTGLKSLRRYGVRSAIRIGPCNRIPHFHRHSFGAERKILKGDGLRGLSSVARRGRCGGGTSTSGEQRD